MKKYRAHLGIIWFLALLEAGTVPGPPAWKRSWTTSTAG